MKAVVYNRPRNVAVQDVPDARIERPTDVLVRITSTNICGSDLHMYGGPDRLPAWRRVRAREPRPSGRGGQCRRSGEGRQLGRYPLQHWLRVLQELRTGPERLLPHHGGSKRCYRTWPALLTASPTWGHTGAARPTWLRVPYGDYNCLKLPPDVEERQNDYVMLADIFPTGWHATELAGLCPGESVVIYGAGPVGLMAAYSAMIKGACMVMVVDRHPDRLRLAGSIGALPIDDSKDSPVDQVMELTNGIGADRGCECVGYQAHDPEGNEHPNMTMNNLVRSVRFTGGIGVVGVYVPQDPAPQDPLYKQGEITFDQGLFWFKGQTIGTGQCNVKAYNRQLRDLISTGRAKPSFIVSHELPLGEAPDAYQHFDARDDGWTKVVLKPAA